MGAPRWSSLLATGFGLGLCMAWWPQWAGSGVAGRLAGREGVDWLLALGLATAWQCAPGMAWRPMAWCGFFRDLFLGGRPGANLCLFIMAGMAAGRWKRGETGLAGGWTRWLAGVVLVLGVYLLRPALEAPNFWVAYAPAAALSPLFAAIATAAAVPLVESGMLATGWRTWRPMDELGRRG